MELRAIPYRNNNFADLFSGKFPSGPLSCMRAVSINYLLGVTVLIGIGAP